MTGSCGVMKCASIATDEDEVDASSGVVPRRLEEKAEEGCWCESFSACWLKRTALCASWPEPLFLADDGDGDGDGCWWRFCSGSLDAPVGCRVAGADDETPEEGEGPPLFGSSAIAVKVSAIAVG